MSTRVHRYGLLPPPAEDAARVWAQMRAAHAYRNTLVAIERGRRAAVREAILAAGDLPALAAAATAAEAAATEAQRAVSAERAAGRTRQASAAGLARLTEAKATRKAAVAALAAARRAIREDPAIVAEVARVDALAADLARNARAHTAAYWGTYLVVEAAMDAARKAPLFDGTAPSDPAFVRWTGEGTVAVQVQGGMDAAAVFGDDTRLRIAPVDERAWCSPIRGERRRYCRTTLALRVGSAGRAPVWARWPLLMHRALPVGAVVKWAMVTVRRVGPREEWALLLTVDVPAATTARDGAVALDLGWRVVAGGLRVGVWTGTDGASGEIRLDPEVVEALRYADTLRSIRDRAFDAAREALAQKLDALGDVPAWLRAATATLRQWRAPARLAMLARRWTTERWAGDADLFDPLEVWRYHDLHLWTWEAAQRRKSLRRRREIYRTAAATLAARYGTLVVEAFDLRKVAQHEDPAAEDKNDRARSNRQLASVSELRAVLTSAFAGCGGTTAKVDAEDTTRTCAACGSLERWDQATQVWHACRTCGALWDQDANAAANLLARWRERYGDGADRGGARDDEKETRWQRTKREAAARRGNPGGAREVPASAAKSVGDEGTGV